MAVRPSLGRLYVGTARSDGGVTRSGLPEPAPAEPTRATPRDSSRLAPRETARSPERRSGAPDVRAPREPPSDGRLGALYEPPPPDDGELEELPPPPPP